jgi:hypothetical protein
VLADSFAIISCRPPPLVSVALCRSLARNLSASLSASALRAKKDLFRESLGGGAAERCVGDLFVRGTERILCATELPWLALLLFDCLIGVVALPSGLNSETGVARSATGVERICDVALSMAAAIDCVQRYGQTVARTRVQASRHKGSHAFQAVST